METNHNGKLTSLHLIVTNWKRGLSGLFLCLFGRGTLPASRHAAAKPYRPLFRGYPAEIACQNPYYRKLAIMLAEGVLVAPGRRHRQHSRHADEPARRTLRLNERRQSELRNVFSPGRAGRGIPLSQAQLQRLPSLQNAFANRVCLCSKQLERPEHDAPASLIAVATSDQNS
jgi:hypothetical protein